MITKLKTECGDQFTAKVEGMLTDLTISESFMNEYKTVKGDKHSNENVENNFQVLSQASWPISVSPQDAKISVPKFLGDVQNEFETYYKSRHQGRCLTWCYQMGTSVI